MNIKEVHLGSTIYSHCTTHLALKPNLNKATFGFYCMVLPRKGCVFFGTITIKLLPLLSSLSLPTVKGKTWYLPNGVKMLLI